MYEKALRCYQEANEMFGPDAELIVYIAECLIKLNRQRSKIKIAEGNLLRSL